MKILLKNGLVIDPENDLDGVNDILIVNGKVERIAQQIDKNSLEDQDFDNQEQKIIDLEGKVVLPGLIDIHTHLREPGYEQKETIKTGCEAAAVGGFTKIACMANTRPVADNPATIEFINSKAREAVVKVFPVGAVTKDLAGENLAEIGFLARDGVRALSDDGKSVMDSDIMRRAMEYADGFGMTIISHCEDENLVGEGVMNEGYYSTILGLKPIPSAAEEVIISRDIILSEFTGCPLHIAHLSTRRGVELVAEAKDKGLPVTAEVTPHHLVLTDKAVMGYDPNTKVNPPLRSEEDREALRRGLQEGIIDVIATDHAPHTFEDKLGEYDRAANGISGLETGLSLIYDKLIRKDIISWQKAVELMVYNPAQVLNISEPGLCPGTGADLTIFDPEQDWQVDPDKFKSRGKNTPFAGCELRGKNLMTIVEGKIVYDNRGAKHEIIY